MWLLVAIAITIDLSSKVRKAKERGEFRTTYGFKQTVNKVVLYYVFCVHVRLHWYVFLSIAFCNVYSVIFLIFIEGKSVLEKVHEKIKANYYNIQ